MTGRGEVTISGVDPQNEFHLSMQITAAFQKETTMWSLMAFFPLVLDQQGSSGLAVSDTSHQPPPSLWPFLPPPSFSQDISE